MRIAMLLIVLGFPLIDLYATVRFARWTGVPVYAWLGFAAIAGLYLLRNERTAFRANTVAAMHGEQPLLRGLFDSGRKVLAGVLFLAAGGPERRHGARAARIAAEPRPRLRAARRGGRQFGRQPQSDRRRVPPARLARYFIRSSNVGWSLSARR